MYRRYGRSPGFREISKRALWMRVALYTFLLVVVLVAQDWIGKSAGSCFAIFDANH